MDIKMRLEFLLLFLCLPVLAGRELAAQSDHDSLQKLADSYYSLSLLEMSDDGRWLSVRKAYDTNSDTVLIFNSRDTEQPFGYRTKVGSIGFLNNGNLLMQSLQQAELLNPEAHTSQYFKDIESIQALKSKSRFVLHYNETEKKRLELRDSFGELKNTIDNVSLFYTAGDDNVYAITEDEDSKFRVVLLNEKSNNILYVTTQKISYIEIDPGEQGVMIYEQNQDSNSQEVLFLALPAGTVFPLKEVLSASIQNGFRKVIREGDIYFLKLLEKSQKADTSLVDIWYGNDNKLEHKIYPPTRELNYVWKPKEKIVKQIGTCHLTDNVNIGSDRYFLSFDPYYFLDYLTFNPPIHIFVYDIVQDRYSILDTIAPVMYLSENGEYALSSRKRDWYLYHIPSVSRKLIPGKGPGKPWFTDDGKAVLFEGDGALWKYELSSGVLSEAAVFKGYQTSIVNGIWEGNGTSKCAFNRHRVNTAEPLVIRLYDPLENLTSYVLWHNGKSEVIVPPTTNNIQFFNYSKSYDCFSWVEENYNMPPRVVFKTEGVVGKTLYQSNKADKAILSLKQQIVTYTNSEGIPLKGILYYPLNYNPSAKYPMVVRIYQVQRNKASNKYPVIEYSQPNNDGFNLRLLIENGYFVFFPDIVYGEKGTGLSALDCVNHALDALENNPSINKSKIGLIGFSHGSYETNFIATHSNRFVTYVSGAGNSDIVRSYFSFNYNFVSPFYWQYENGQYDMKKSFSEDKNLYFQNNPIYSVDHVNAPVLLWTGMKDQNIYWEQTMEFYIGLKRNDKKVIALFYPDEPHAILTPDACRDLVSRILSWFDYFLKGEEDAEWINKEIRKQPQR